ncbi:MAG TPA: DUF2249 domain-containing protein [Burkholderiaceae bacterium]
MTLTTYGTKIDLRPLLPRERHPLIFSTFRSLGVGQSLELINDHDPRPLYFQLQAQGPGTVAWEYLENGPDTWRVRITRLAATRAEGGCCGSCGGA